MACLVASGVLVTTAGAASAADPVTDYPNPYTGPSYFALNNIALSGQKVNVFVATDFNNGAYAGSSPEMRQLKMWHTDMAVKYWGGIIQRQLGIEGSFVAELPVEGLQPLQDLLSTQWFRCVNPISTAQLEAFKVNSVQSPTGISQVAGIEPYNADLDPYSLKNVARAMGAETFWNAGFKGAYSNGVPVDVALIDTGLAPKGVFEIVPGSPANAAGVHGPDLSFDSNVSTLAHNDSVGHGTHMAGIINAVAPKSRVVSIKLGDHDGAADVSQFIAAIDWVREHNNDYGLNIRVLNLSFGFISANKWTDDELSKAVDAAWKAGIVVVISAGNERNSAIPNFVDPGILAPAYNKYAIAVAAYDTGLNVYSRSDDAATLFTSGQTSDNKRLPDFAAPGSHISSLRVAGSSADDQITQTFCDMKTTDEAVPYPVLNNGTLVRGSGTSQAAAAASGAVALLLSKNPTLTPDAVKIHLKKSVRPVPNSTRDKTGDGSLDLNLAYGSTISTTATQNFDKVVGAAPIDMTRGEEWLVDGTANPAAISPTEATYCGFRRELSGECDIFGKKWNSQWHSTAATNWLFYSTTRPAAGGMYTARVSSTNPGHNVYRLWTDRAAVQQSLKFADGTSVPIFQPAGAQYNGAVMAAAPAVTSSALVNKGLVGWAFPSVKWVDPSWSLRMWPDDASPSGYFRGSNGVWTPANNWEGIRWRAAGWDGFRWREAGWDGFRWRDNAWVGFRWRSAPTDGANFVGYRWRDSAWSGGRWK